ncbi:MAG: AmmeMemoRadiSam system protein B [Parcubacteria group bacterium GW2011_GWA2_38_13b]|nr:MAG: AmmeMemoRadiSam system protein B [Parcubacteria group bacterium GW2011_GWA2_38_13b]
MKKNAFLGLMIFATGALFFSVAFFAAIIWRGFPTSHLKIFENDKERIIDINNEKIPQDETLSNNFHFASHSGKEFYGDLEIPAEKKLDEKIFGGILSHHLLAASEISKYFANLKNKKFGTVVLIGPDHFGIGDEISVSEYPYKTPWGFLQSDRTNIVKLIDNEAAAPNEKAFEGEHSISSLVSYIKYFFPDTKFIPIVIKRNASEKKLENLSQALDKILPDDSLVLASVDFSHHLGATAAEFHDETSIAAITNFDYARILRLEIDSPPSIYVLLKYLEKRGAKKIKYKNANSANLSGNFESDDITSYLFAYFTKGFLEENEGISILNFGDAMFDRWVKEKIQKDKDPFELIKGAEGNFLKGTDFIVLNLEGPITAVSDCQKKLIAFRFEPSAAKLLFQNNITLVNLANNHSLDCYEKGLNDTRENLDKYGISYFGGGHSLENGYIIKKVGSQKAAFIGIDDTVGAIDLNDFYPMIKKLKSDNDYLAVNIHWGYEYAQTPSDTQKKIAYQLIDNGADVIFGHHPHVVQSLEIYKNKPIFYSLGNFIFDQLGEETNKGIGVGAVLKKEFQQFYVFPYKILDTQPKLLPPKEAFDYCKIFLKNISDKKNCTFRMN